MRSKFCISVFNPITHEFLLSIIIKARTKEKAEKMFNNFLYKYDITIRYDSDVFIEEI